MMDLSWRRTWVAEPGCVDRDAEREVGRRESPSNRAMDQLSDLGALAVPALRPKFGLRIIGSR